MDAREKKDPKIEGKFKGDKVYKFSLFVRKYLTGFVLYLGRLQ